MALRIDPVFTSNKLEDRYICIIVSSGMEGGGGSQKDGIVLSCTTFLPTPHAVADIHLPPKTWFPIDFHIALFVLSQSHAWYQRPVV